MHITPKNYVSFANERIKNERKLTDETDILERERTVSPLLSDAKPKPFRLCTTQTDSLGSRNT